MDPRYDVAIFAPRAAPLYADLPRPAPGGAEVQTRNLARALADHGLRVCHIVRAEPWLPASADGVDIVPLPTGQPGRVRRARQLVRALRRADASLYVQRSAGPDAGVLALFARLRRRRFVLSTSWDGDLTEPLIDKRVSRAAFRLGIRLADTIVVQTDDQLQAARQGLDRPLTLIRSIAEPAPSPSLAREAFLWIGRVVDYKDPLAFVDLAERVPQARFWMVADSSGDEDEDLTALLEDRAASTPNLELLPTRPREQLGELYGRAIAVVNTSHIEGFPNTFIEGWARGTPALSLRLDPDRIIERHQLGACAHGSADELAASARALWADGEDPEMAERARRYIASEHAPSAVAERWAELLARLRA